MLAVWVLVYTPYIPDHNHIYKICSQHLSILHAAYLRMNAEYQYTHTHIHAAMRVLKSESWPRPSNLFRLMKSLSRVVSSHSLFFFCFFGLIHEKTCNFDFWISWARVMANRYLIASHLCKENCCYFSYNDVFFANFLFERQSILILADPIESRLHTW